MYTQTHTVHWNIFESELEGAPSEVESCYGLRELIYWNVYIMLKCGTFCILDLVSVHFVLY